MQRRVVILAGLVFLGCSLPLTAAGGCRLTVRSNTGALEARIGSDGAVRTPSGALLGTLGSTVRGQTGELLGRVDAAGVLRDGGGRMLVRFNRDGEIRSPSGALLFRLDSTGKLRDPQGRLLARFEGYTPGCLPVAAAFLVFFGGYW